jgi:hypothetical protein
VAHELPVDEAPLTAAGAEKLMVYLPSKRLLARYDLLIGAREQIAALEEPGNVFSIAMGVDSSGPLLVDLRRDDRRFDERHPPVFYDPAKLKLQVVKYRGRISEQEFSDSGWRASADGRTFVDSGSGNIARVEDGNVIALTELGRSRDLVEPTYDGRIFINGGAAITRDGDQLEAFTAQRGRGSSARFTAAMLGPLVVGYTFGRPYDEVERSVRPYYGIYVPGHATPLLKLYDIAALEEDGNHGPQALRQERVFFAPHLAQLVTLPLPYDRLLIYRFDLEAELKHRPDDYLAVVSELPRHPETGKPWSHQLEIRSKRGGTACKLEDGPAGMTVSKTGLLSWTMPPAAGDKPHSIVISITAGGADELLYTFPLRVVKAAAPASTTAAPATPAASGTVSPVGTANPVPAGTANPAPAAKTARTWTSRDGKFAVSAQLVEVKDGKITLKLADGKLITVLKEHLSDADQPYFDNKSD